MAIRSARNVEKQKKKNRRALPRKKLTRNQGNTLAGRRRLTGREQRNQAAGALHQLQVRNEFTHSFEIFARKQRLAFDHDEHVEFRCGEALGFRFVLPVFLGIGPEQLAKRIVDFDSLDAEYRAHDQRGQNDARHDRRLNRNQP